MTPEQIAKSGSESAHQKALFAWAAMNMKRWPQLKYLFAIPNGGLRDKITAARLKAEGVKAGVPDVMLPWPRGSYAGLFIEMKKPGEKVRKDSAQEEWHDYLRNSFYCVQVCDDWKEATVVLSKYLTGATM